MMKAKTTSGSPAPMSARNSATWELLLQSVLVPALCIVGLVGNSLSIFVLSRQRMRRSAQLPERAVHIGLVGLAVSDMASTTRPTCIAYIGGPEMSSTSGGTN